MNSTNGGPKTSACEKYWGIKVIEYKVYKEKSNELCLYESKEVNKGNNIKV